MWQKNVTCVVGIAQCKDEIVKCEKKKVIELPNAQCEVGIAQCEDGAVKYEKKVKEPPNVTKELSHVMLEPHNVRMKLSNVRKKSKEITKCEKKLSHVILELHNVRMKL